MHHYSTLLFCCAGQLHEGMLADLLNDVSQACKCDVERPDAAELTPCLVQACLAEFFCMTCFIFAATGEQYWRDPAVWSSACCGVCAAW